MMKSNEVFHMRFMKRNGILDASKMEAAGVVLQ